jgi:hypothetical protein
MNSICGSDECRHPDSAPSGRGIWEAANPGLAPRRLGSAPPAPGFTLEPLRGLNHRTVSCLACEPSFAHAGRRRTIHSCGRKSAAQPDAVLRRKDRGVTVTRTMTYSVPWRSVPRPRRGLRVKPGAGNAEPKRRGASPGVESPKSPALKGRNRDCPRAAGKDKTWGTWGAPSKKVIQDGISQLVEEARNRIR